MSNSYTSEWTGSQIDDAVRKIINAEWKSNVVLSTSGVKGGDGQPGIAWSTLSSYPLLVFTGYKEGVSQPDNQTTSIVVSANAISDRQGQGYAYTLNLPFAVRDANSALWPTVLFFWLENDYLHWKTAGEYSGSYEFVVTRVEGFTI